MRFLHVNVNRFHCMFCALFKISFLLFFEVAVVTFCRLALFLRVFVVFSFLTSLLLIVSSVFFFLVVLCVAAAFFHL